MVKFTFTFNQTITWLTFVVMLISLKITGIIAWSWWIVTMPITIPIIMMVLFSWIVNFQRKARYVKKQFSTFSEMTRR